MPNYFQISDLEKKFDFLLVGVGDKFIGLFETVDSNWYRIVENADSIFKEIDYEVYIKPEHLEEVIAVLYEFGETYDIIIQEPDGRKLPRKQRDPDKIAAQEMANLMQAWQNNLKGMNDGN